MIRYATIGTGFITDSFINGAAKSGEMKLAAVYSRTEEKGRKLALQYGEDVLSFTDLEKLSKSSLIDAVYIASPNAMHASQAKLFLQHGKHVLVEKAAASNAMELMEVMNLAQEKGLVFMEAMKSLTMPAYLLLKENLHRIGRIRKYVGIYCQYSSRYDRHKSGEPVNTFQKKFSNGALMDIGIYCLYPLVDLFGEPEIIKAQATILEDGGVDGSGSMLLKYRDMEAALLYSKISDSHLPSEIQGEKGSILIDRIGSPRELTLMLRDGSKEVLVPETEEEDMVYEALEFVKTIRENRSFSSINHRHLAESVHKVMDEARRQVGLSFPSDEKYRK
ncbi:Gfo/Idh/MocA family protein [Proteiniclasticum sp. C24MP]|uniref:Gfo/Idh/MocA family protein n=1 Tax=Proteiniclasticum sp. C24MP TaxID=3374101 RepID=UPI0037549D8C